MASDIFERRESEVRSYCRSFPVVLNRAKGAFLYDENQSSYLDFFMGAGALNYGHNDPAIKNAVIDYLKGDGVVHSLDLWTVAKRRFLEVFEKYILQPRNLDYKIQFTGPTGANAVEAAIKLAKIVKKRSGVVAFTNAYHGLSAGALALTGNRHFRNEAFITRLNAAFVPFDGYFGAEVDTIEYFRKYLEDNSSGLDVPAAVIVETVQAEGGVNVASREWLRRLEELCREFDMLLIVDDIQVGNGRTGDFFSFEDSGIHPDMVVMSKSIGGLGLPMSLLLIARECDQWKPAEHTGTFRGNDLAFVAAAEAINIYWQNDAFQKEIKRKSGIFQNLLISLVARHPELSAKVRGRGLIWGVELPSIGMAKLVSQEAFRRNLIIELAGPDDQVLKFLPPLVIDDSLMKQGVDIIDQSMATVTKFSGEFHQ